MEMNVTQSNALGDSLSIRFAASNIHATRFRSILDVSQPQHLASLRRHRGKDHLPIVVSRDTVMSWFVKEKERGKKERKSTSLPLIWSSIIINCPVVKSMPSPHIWLREDKESERGGAGALTQSIRSQMDTNS